MPEASRWFSVQDKGDRISIRFTVPEISGEEDAREIGKALGKVMAQFPGRTLELDLSILEIVSSAFLGQLITFHKQAQAVKGRVILTGYPSDFFGFHGPFGSIDRH